jgi:hypothetical protein
MTQHVKNARKTRGRPFQRGNPGRPKGARNKRTILVPKAIAASKRALNSVREPSAAALMRADVTRR